MHVVCIHTYMYHTIHKLIVCLHANILMSESESPGRPFSSAPDTVVIQNEHENTLLFIIK